VCVAEVFEFAGVTIGPVSIGARTAKALDHPIRSGR
jgi:hypothetical protein